MVLFIMIGNGYAEEPEYDFDTNDYSITTYRGAGGDITVPAEMEGCPVEMIESAVFYCNKEIRSVVLPETLLAIGSSNFYAADELQSVVLPESLIAIDAFNFFWCPQITEITIPASVCYIGNDCFEDCENLRTIRFLGEVPVMGLCCFEYLPEDAVAYVPDDLVEEYRAALPETLSVLASGQKAVTVDYTAAEEEFEFDAETGTIIEYLGFATRVDIPATIDGVPVNAIGDEAFFGNNYMYYVTVPEGTVSIGENAFASATHLSYADLPSTLQSIGDSAFYGFKGQVLKLPEGLKTIGNEAFYWSNTEEVYFPSTIEHIGEAAFGSSYVGYLYFEGKQLPEIAEDAFEGLSISDIDINWQASREQMQAAQAFFDGIGLETRVWRMQNPNVDYIYDGLDSYADGVMTGYTGTQTHVRPWDEFDGITVTALGNGAFKENKTIEYFAVPYNDEFTTIGTEAFADSNIKYIDLFDSVTTIEAGAFRNCTNLKEIEIPASVTSIAADAFEGCTGLEKITFLCDISVLTEGMLDSCTSLVEYDGVPDANEEEKFALRVALYGMPEVKITRQPEDVTVPEGEMAEISLEAEGEGKLTYAWYVMDIWSNEFTLDESCTESTYSLTMNGDADCTEVYCVVTDIYGTSVTSETATFYMAEPEMPEPVAIGEEGKLFFGLWNLQYMELEGMILEAADLGMVMDLTLNEDGTVSVFDGETTEMGVWTLRDGVAELMGMALTLTDDGRLCASEEGAAMYFVHGGDAPSGTVPPADETQKTTDVEAFFGVWNGVYVEAEGQTLYLDDFGMEMVLCVYPDGTATMYDGETNEEAFWTFEDGIMYIDAMVLTVTDEGLCIAEDGALMYFEFAAYIESANNRPSSGNAITRNEDRLNRKFICESYTALGNKMDAATLGSEYSLYFYADGTMDFCLGGTTLPKLPWGLDQVSIGLNKVDAFVINYYGTPFNAVLTDVGFDMDYGSITLHFMPAK